MMNMLFIPFFVEFIISLTFIFMCRKGPEWLSIRSPAQKSIKPGVLKQYINPQSQCAEELVTWLENHGNNNPGIKDALMRYSADGITMRTIKITKKDAILNNIHSPIQCFSKEYLFKILNMVENHYIDVGKAKCINLYVLCFHSQCDSGFRQKDWVSTKNGQP